MRAFLGKIAVAALISIALCCPRLSAQASEAMPADASSQPGDITGPTAIPPAMQLLASFQDSDIKFDLRDLMDILRDSRHEGWVLAAYPDPKTSRPLIGAGFGLDVPERAHPQLDPLNPHPFLEPSSEQLWQAAGLPPEKLQAILDRFDRDLDAWKKKRYRRKIRMHALTPELTEEEATRLLRISTIQAVENARAYCRGFDHLTGPQQMALSQLVFQMGVNLEEFTQFLAAINGPAVHAPTVQTVAQTQPAIETGQEHWKAVQQTLIDSDWARRYRIRAISVIAMFDPNYLDDPRAAEQQIAAVLHPPVQHRHKKRRTSQTRRRVA